MRLIREGQHPEYGRLIGVSVDDAFEVVNGTLAYNPNAVHACKLCPMYNETCIDQPVEYNCQEPGNVVWVLPAKFVTLTLEK